jgi:hypothetical protein
MTFVGRKRSVLITSIILMALVAASAVPGQAQTRTLFKDIPPADPKREVLQAVLDSSFYSMRGQFSSQEWTSGHYGGAWERARQYFPNHAYFVQPGQYFMTHGFSADGKLYMEVHESAYLNLSLENWRTFKDRSIVAEYGRMRGAADGREAAAFAEKLGRLEPYFRNEGEKGRLKKMLGDRLYDRLLEELSRESYHMFAGALLHEGMHAKMDDDALVARIQNDYKGCTLPVQWDELRAYMAEINYHKRFYNWAVGDLMHSWRQIENLLKELEAFRKKPKPLSAADRAKLEEIKAKIKAYIALIRLRAREIWQSAQRVQGLVTHFQQEYVKPNPPADVADMMRKLTVQVNDYVTRVGQTLQQMEVLLRSLEANLDLWNEWAACTRPSPPPKQDIDSILERFRRLSWPKPPGEVVDDLRKKAEEEIPKVPGSAPGQPGPARKGTGGRSGGGAGSRAAGGAGSRQGFVISAGARISWPSMAGQNAYLDYLDEVWTGNIPAFGAEAGFGASAGWAFSPALEAGLYFERAGASVRGTLQAVPSDYLSKHGLTVVGAYAAGRTRAVLGPLRLLVRAGAGYGAASYTEDESGFVTRGKDHGVVWHAAGGLEAGLGGGLSLDVLGGYRSAAFDGFGVSFFLPGNPPVRLDFGGAYAQAGLSFRF